MAAVEREREAARLTISELTSQISESQRIVGAAEMLAVTLKEALADTRRRLEEATANISRTERSLAAAEAREAALAGQLAALQGAHAAELARLKDVMRWRSAVSEHAWATLPKLVCRPNPRCRLVQLGSQVGRRNQAPDLFMS